MRHPRLILSAKCLALFFTVLVLASCEEEKAMKNDSPGNISSLGKEMMPSISYTVTTTSSFDEGMPLKSSTTVPYGMVQAGFSNPTEPLVISHNVTITTINGVRQLSVSPGETVVSPRDQFFPQSQTFTVTGSDISSAGFREFNKVIDPNHLSVIETEYRQSIGGQAGVMAQSAFFHDIVTDKENLMTRASELFDAVTHVEGDVYQFTRTTNRGTVRITYDASQSRTLSSVFCQNGSPVTESSFEYQTIDNVTLRTRTTSVRHVTFPDETVHTFTMTRTLSNIQINN